MQPPDAVPAAPNTEAAPAPDAEAPPPPRRRAPKKPTKQRPYLLALKPDVKIKRPRSENISEWALQCAVACFLDSHPQTRLVWNHYPSGGYRGNKTAQWLAWFGQKPGVPDVMIYRPFRYKRKRYNGLAIELKSVGANGPSPCQDHWLQTLNEECGWLTVLARTFSTTRELIERLYGPLPSEPPPYRPPSKLISFARRGGFHYPYPYISKKRTISPCELEDAPEVDDVDEVCASTDDLDSGELNDLEAFFGDDTE